MSERMSDEEFECFSGGNPRLLAEARRARASEARLQAEREATEEEVGRLITETHDLNAGLQLHLQERDAAIRHAKKAEKEHLAFIAAHNFDAFKRVQDERDAAQEQVRVLGEALDAIVNKDWWVPLNCRDELDRGRAALAATAKGEKLDAQLKKSESLTREAAAIGRSLHMPKDPK